MSPQSPPSESSRRSESQSAGAEANPAPKPRQSYDLQPSAPKVYTQADASRTPGPERLNGVAPIPASPQQQRAEVDAFEQQIAQPQERPRRNSEGQQSGWKRRLKRYGWIIPVAGLVGVLGFGLYNRLRPGDAPASQEQQANPLSVRVAEADFSTVRAWVSGGGLVQATQFRNLSFDRAGEVTFIASSSDGDVLRVGDRVQAGELLATIDDRDLQADLQQARAALAESREQVAAQQSQIAAAQAQVAQARAQVQEAQAQVNRSRSALDLAQSEFQRYESLYAQGVISASNLDQRRNAVQDARANLTAAESRVVAARGQVDAAQSQVSAARDQLSAVQARVDTAQAGVTQAEVALEDTQLYAPFSGTVAYLNLRQGEQFVPQGGTAQLDQNDAAVASNVPIVLVDPGELEVELSLPSDSGQQVAAGQAAYVLEADNLMGNLVGSALGLGRDQMEDSQSLIRQSRAQGQVVSVTPSINPGLRTREATVGITDGTENLQHGDRVTGFIAVATDDNAVTVPLDAVVYRDRQPYAFVVVAASEGADSSPDSTLVEQRLVTLGIRGLNEQQILSGVVAGEQVVVEGQERLVNQTPVRVVGEALRPNANPSSL